MMLGSTCTYGEIKEHHVSLGCLNKIVYLRTVKQNRQFIKTILSLNKTRLKDLKFVLYGVFAYIVRAFFYKCLG